LTEYKGNYAGVMLTNVSLVVTNVKEAIRPRLFVSGFPDGIYPRGPIF